MPHRRRLPALFLLGCLGCAVMHRGDSPADTCAPRGLSFVHPVGDPPTHLQQACQAVPVEARDRVYVFALNGMDPLYLGNLNGLCASMRQLGFRNTRCAQSGQAPEFRTQIIALRRRDPDARIALVGYSAGANRARDLANELKDQGVTIQLLVYLGADTIENVPSSRPSNVGQVVNITGHGFLPRGGDLFYHGTDIDGAQNRRLNARHMLLPSRPETVETLAARLIDIAQAPPAPVSAPEPR